MRFVLMLALLLTFTAPAWAECVRYKPPPPSNGPPDFDGPGSFGELQDTVTLDCLRYVGSIEKQGDEHVLIKDERGTIHVLRTGSFVGENTGMIKKIDADAIYIEQIVSRNGEWKPIIVKFPKR